MYKFELEELNIMTNYSINENQDLEQNKPELIDNEFFSLKFTDSLYKKDIGKFIEYLSSYFFNKFNNL